MPHTWPSLHAKDVSSNNLLIQQHADGDGGCRLLLADPSMCFLISDLSRPDWWVGTGTVACLHPMVWLEQSIAHHQRSVATVVSQTSNKWQPNRRHLPCSDCFISTWLWGPLSARYGQFDSTADNYSLSFCFLEVRNVLQQCASCPVARA